MSDKSNFCASMLSDIDILASKLLMGDLPLCLQYLADIKLRVLAYNDPNWKPEHVLPIEEIEFEQ